MSNSWCQTSGALAVRPAASSTAIVAPSSRRRSFELSRLDEHEEPTQNGGGIGELIGLHRGRVGHGVLVRS
jgi:hypothetical protein